MSEDEARETSAQPSEPIWGYRHITLVEGVPEIYGFWVGSVAALWEAYDEDPELVAAQFQDPRVTAAAVREAVRYWRAVSGENRAG